MGLAESTVFLPALLKPETATVNVKPDHRVIFCDLTLSKCTDSSKAVTLVTE